MAIGVHILQWSISAVTFFHLKTASRRRDSTEKCGLESFASWTHHHSHWFVYKTTNDRLRTWCTRESSVNVWQSAFWFCVVQPIRAKEEKSMKSSLSLSFAMEMAVCRVLSLSAPDDFCLCVFTNAKSKAPQTKGNSSTSVALKFARVTKISSVRFGLSCFQVAKSLLGVNSISTLSSGDLELWRD